LNISGVFVDKIFEFNSLEAVKSEDNTLLIRIAAK